VNVVYGFGFADLGPEPIVLTVPDSGGRYYMIEVVDMWTSAFAYPVGGASGYTGGKFAFGTDPELATAMKNPATFQGPPPLVVFGSEQPLQPTGSPTGRPGQPQPTQPSQGEIKP
jgi:hypothetical protein